MDTITVTPNLAMLRVGGWPVYVWHDDDSVTVIDTGAPGSGAQMLTAVPRLDRIVLTHGHVDHCGSAAELQEATGATVSSGAGDAAVIRAGAAMPPRSSKTGKSRSANVFRSACPTRRRPSPCSTSCTVLHALHERDVLDFGGGAEVLSVPGHTDGSIAIYLPRHGVLFTGDTVANVETVMLGVFNQDRAQTVASFKRLAALDVATACFGHGEPIASGAGAQIRDAAATLVE